MLIQVEGLRREAGPRLPDWLRKSVRNVEADHELKKMLRMRGLHTVCEEARCPNRNDCFARGAATFMILGDVCSRSCGFCSVKTGRGLPLESLSDEPEQVAEAAAHLGLSYVVITSVNRDELPDGGAAHFAKTIRAVRRRLPGAKIEVLTPDFKGDRRALYAVLDSAPDTFNHNVETVPRLYSRVRPQADYRQSLDVLSEARAYAASVLTKSGFMVGLGEQRDEVKQLLEDLREQEVDVVTIGQYLQPTRAHLPVAEYVHPNVFDDYKSYGERLGFRAVFSGPLVRSSFMAETVSEIAVEDGRSRIEDGGSRIEDGRSRIEDGRSRIEDDPYTDRS
jgi:lipoic acid synthetase